MEARKLQLDIERYEPEYPDDDTRLQLLALQVWANIAVSLETVAKALATWEQALLGQEKPEWEPGTRKFPSQEEAREYIGKLKDNDSPYRLG